MWADLLLSPWFLLAASLLVGLSAPRLNHWLALKLDAAERGEDLRVPAPWQRTWWAGAPAKGLLGLFAVTAAWTILTLLKQPAGLPQLAWAAWGWLMLTAAWLDGRTTWLPNVYTMPLLWAGLLFSIHPQALNQAPGAIVGAAAGYLAMSALSWGMSRLLGRPVLGEGDVWLIAGFGAWLGLRGLVFVSTAAFALLLSYAVLRRRRGLMSFGPFLVAAAMGYVLGLQWGVWPG